jgi:Fic family protein
MGPIEIALNHRQTDIISHALKHPNYLYEIQSHKVSQDITYETARTDLSGLEKLGLLEKSKRGKAFVFQSPSNLSDRIMNLNKKLSHSGQ